MKGNSYIDKDLDALFYEVGEDLLLVASHWSEIDEGTRGTLRMEWANDMDILEGLDESYQAGEMNAEQQKQYLEIKDTLLGNLSVVRRMRFSLPKIEGLR